MYSSTFRLLRSGLHPAEYYEEMWATLVRDGVWQGETWSRKKNGEMKMGNSGSGSIWHLAHSAIEAKAGVKYTAVPFGGAAPAVVALLGGHIDAVAVSPAEVAAQVQAGKLRMLAVAADKRLRGFDQVPTLRERDDERFVDVVARVGIDPFKERVYA